MGFVCLYII